MLVASPSKYSRSPCTTLRWVPLPIVCVCFVDSFVEKFKKYLFCMYSSFMHYILTGVSPLSTPPTPSTTFSRCQIHFLSISLHKGTGLPGRATELDIAGYRKSRHKPLYRDWRRNRRDQAGVMEGKRVLEEMTGIGEHLGGDMETQCSRNFLESTRVTLARTPRNRTQSLKPPCSVTRWGFQRWDWDIKPATKPSTYNLCFLEYLLV